MIPLLYQLSYAATQELFFHPPVETDTDKKILETKLEKNK